MLEYEPADRISLADIQNHDWVLELSSINSADDVKAEFVRTTDPAREGRFRGVIVNTGEKGGTDPYKDNAEDFIVKEEEYPAYNRDLREIEVAQAVNITEIIDSLNKFCEKRRKK